MTAPSTFHIGVTRDVLGQDGEPWFPDLGLELLDNHPSVSWEVFPERIDELEPKHLALYDGILLLAPRLTARSLAQGARTSVVARFGVGYDSVDLEACTAAGIALTITPDGVRRPVA